MTDLRVAELWRYPVKSTGGESLQGMELDRRGPIGDRLWAVYDEERRLGSGKDSRRFRRMDGLLDVSARLVDGIPVITAPDGGHAAGEGESADEVLGRVLGRPGVRLARETDIPHHDAAPIHIITTAGLAWLQELLPETELEPRRFRPNIVIEARGIRPVERDWIGSVLEIGSVRLRVVGPTQRCRMVGAPQPDLDDDNRVLKMLGSISDLEFGVYAEVVEAGSVSVGELVAIQ